MLVSTLYSEIVACVSLCDEKEAAYISKTSARYSPTLVCLSPDTADLQ